MSDPMAEIRASFFMECEELLEALQDGLEAMESGAGDEETVNVVFRAVHSIKGGAGAFGLDDLVAFAHRFETALDDVRAGKLVPDANVMKLFFSCGDKLTDLVHESRDGVEHDPATTADLFSRLDAIIGAAPADEDEEIHFQPAALSLDLDLDLNLDLDPALPVGSDPQCDPLIIEFRPDNDLFNSGNEPLYLFRALRDLGDLEVTCDETDLPLLTDLKPDAPHLSWKLTLSTTEGEAAVQEVFEFVDGLCDLSITRANPTGANGAVCEDPETVETSPFPPSDCAPNTVENPANDIESTIREQREAAQESGKPAPSDPATSASGKPSPPKKSTPSAPRATVRVDLERIDKLVNLVGEIVINQAMLSQSVEEAGLPPNSQVRTGLDEFLQLTRDIQESVMRIRAQPVKSLFQRMARIVREASASVGKEVRLQTEGENTEIDKTVIERLADPLTHMIRNAVDHGLETHEERIAAGKDGQGIITLAAAHRSGRVMIEVSDDGGGINREKVLQTAIEKGLVDPDLQLSDSDIDSLLFLPGFSTASEVSNLSGRGVGMDVVRSAIQELGGRIAISSTPGHGTVFSISLPLTLAVLDGMIVKVADETLVVPLNTIQETLSPGDDDIRPFGPETHVIRIRDSFIPLLDLGAELGYRQPMTDYSRSVTLLIAQDDGTQAALVVDMIVDQRQVVIKGLQESYGHVPGIAAATILGDGQIALILDPVDLILNASGCTRHAPNHDKIAG